MPTIRTLLEALDDDDGEYDDDSGDEQASDVDDYRSRPYAQTMFQEFTYSADAARSLLWAYQTQAVDTILGALDPAQPKLLHLATGGGKTRVANDVVVQWNKRHSGPVLWITKDWRLLKQAAQDLRRRHQKQSIARLGGDGQALHPLRKGKAQHVIYTTIHTLILRLKKGVLRSLRPSLVVWDECHWGERAKAGTLLTACKKSRIPVLGLTATPHQETRYEIAFSKTFHELVDDGFLARPVVQAPVKTGVRWEPTIRSQFGDVTRESLNELAQNQKRNRCIVDQYGQQVARYGKTIVFACNIEHADRLAKLFCGAGIAARAIHCGLSDGANKSSLEKFKSGAVQVLVNVEMLTHGIDVPDARTVFLCRPTTSDILFAQMVGRGARRVEGKTSFNIVEFTDNVTRHGELFETSQRYFTGSGIGKALRPSVVRQSRSPQLHEHEFDPKGAPTWIPNDPSLPESVLGLWYREGQTFGIEFELTTQDGSIPNPESGPKWTKTADAVRKALAAALPGLVASKVIREYAGATGKKDCSVWNVEYDASVGWEVTSRILQNQAGFVEVDAACVALDKVSAELGLCVNYRTGTHVHIGWLGNDEMVVKRAIELVRLFEPALATLVAPSRVAKFDRQHYDLRQPNEFCKPISSVFDKNTLARMRSIEDILRVAHSDGARYVTFNPLPMAYYKTVEARMHNGTLEARKILLWVSLWQQILWAAANRAPVPAVPDRKVINPDGDIVQLARKYLPNARQPQQRRLLELLATRRAEIFDQWKRTPALASWVAASANWELPARF